MAQDPQYEQVRKIWNASVDKRPLMMARAKDAGDVAKALQFARESALLVAIRGGGHNVGGRALCDGGLVVDLSLMRGVSVDPATRTVTVEGGATLGDLDRETHPFGLAVPVGIVSKTGVAGLTLGGGVGWLMRKYGMTIDNVLTFEVVGAQGESLTVSASENEDLFWALRGGGGNFGVVTSFRFRAHPVSTVLAGPVIHPGSAAYDLLRFFRDFMTAAADELTAYVALRLSPEGMPIAILLCCYCGDPAEGAKVIDPLRKFGTPVMDGIQEMPHPAFQTLLDDSFPDGNHNYWKSSLQKELSDGAIGALVEHAYKMPSRLSIVAVECYGGAASRVKSSDTAFPHRGLAWDVIAGAQWTAAEESSENRAWARGLAEAVEPFGSGAHLLGALDQESSEVIHSAFGDNLPRLVQVKRRYDPTNLFRVNQNIEPAAA